MKLLGLQTAMRYETGLEGLKFTAIESNSSIRFNTEAVIGEYLYSLNGSKPVDYIIGDTIGLNKNDTVVFRAKTTNAAFCPNANSTNPGITMIGKIAASGNIQYLLDENGSEQTAKAYSYKHMFCQCSSLIQAPELPAKYLEKNCYNGMFYGCTNLTETPVLSSTNLAAACYAGMFKDCTALTSITTLSAEILYADSYSEMFTNCKSIINAPILSAKILNGSYCCYGMFKGCKNLDKAPKLNATTLAQGCYYFMFSDCTSLTQAPVLSATTLAKDCYTKMFSNCTKLTDIYTKQTSFTGCTNWLHNHSNATFHCSPNLVIPEESQRTETNVPPLWNIDQTYE